jgi:hypothetical protein
VSRYQVTARTSERYDDDQGHPQLEAVLRVHARDAEEAHQGRLSPR